jgi:polar amino acid transport system substrate-binding protein
MATNAAFPPYEFYENGQIVGIDAEIAAAIADKLGMELVIENMEFGSIIAAVQSGKADVGLAGMTVDEERLKSVDFSTSYATGIQVVIVKEDSAVASIDDLTGKTIGVQQDTTGDIYASAPVEEGGFGEDSVDRYNTGAEAVLALQQDKADAVIIDNEPAKIFVEQNEGLKILDTEYANEDYAICVAKGSPLLADINAALEELIADGTVQTIIDKYITDK